MVSLFASSQGSGKRNHSISFKKIWLPLLKCKHCPKRIKNLTADNVHTSANPSYTPLSLVSIGYGYKCCWCGLYILFFKSTWLLEKLTLSFNVSPALGEWGKKYNPLLVTESYEHESFLFCRVSVWLSSLFVSQSCPSFIQAFIIKIHKEKYTANEQNIFSFTI